LVFCGHEYTIANLKFVLYIDANNKAAQSKLAWAEKQRASKLPTIPSTIGDELEFNIFMRVGNPTLQLAINAKDSVACMDKLRDMKNGFKA
jgi:hydroxyacylglutathione hydrolase